MRKILPLLLLSILISCKSKETISQKNTSDFSAEQLRMIHEGKEKDPMRVFLITNPDDSLLLRTPSEKVSPVTGDPDLEMFCQRLYATVTDSSSLGVGIAAPQVGILKRIIWVQRFDKKNLPFELYINPKIIQYTEKKQPCPEGCLSIPGKKATTQNRAYAILLEYSSPDGTHHTEMVEGFTAVIFQHEVDHLDGILFTDYLGKN